MKLKLDENWTTNNGGYPLFDSEVERLVSVVPSEAQLLHAKTPFYCFVHFGMNTATGREWGNATETVEDFTIEKINPEQWVKAVKSSGAQGLILTCKHHDGFCLWNTDTTDFNVMNTALATDVVREVSRSCLKNGLKFGVYISPWDMHEKCYATERYNDFFCRQLSELLTDYGEIFEVWFDGAKGAEAKAFDYDWQRYYSLVRTLQPSANIAICGPDIRWVGNEAGKTRKCEYCVVSSTLTVAEIVAHSSQHAEEEASLLQSFTSKDENLGSREALKNSLTLCWYPAEVDVSIRKGWFYPGGGNVKGAGRLFDIYLNSVGNNSFLLLNVPPNKKGVISFEDKNSLKKLGKKISAITSEPVIEQSFGELKATDGYLEFRFDSKKKLRYCVIEEDTAFSQRVEKFDLYLLSPSGNYRLAYRGTVIGMKKIIPLRGSSIGALLVIRQSRSAPVIKKLGFYL